MPPESNKAPSKASSSRRSKLTMTRQTLPIEVMSRIAPHMAQADLASFALASKAYLDIFARQLYKRVRLLDISVPHNQYANKWRRKFLSFVEVLSVQPHTARSIDGSCNGIAKTCTNLQLVIIDDKDEPGYTFSCGKFRPPCQCFRPDRPIKIVFRERPSPWISTPDRISGWDAVKCHENLKEERRELRRRDLKGMRQAVIEFGVWRTRPPWATYQRGDVGFHAPWNDVSLAFTSEVSSLDDLLLFFTPLTPDRMTRFYCTGRDREPGVDDDLTIDGSTPTLSRQSTSGVPFERFDLCSTLALTCASVPDGCTMTIANIDQLPTSAKTWVSGGDERRINLIAASQGGEYLRSRTGTILKAVDPTTLSGERPEPTLSLANQSSHGQCATTVVTDQAELLKAEEMLSDRLETVQIMTKRWIEAILSDKGKANKVESTWAKIKWITLREYLDTLGREEEWVTHPERGEWI